MVFKWISYWFWWWSNYYCSNRREFSSLFNSYNFNRSCSSSSFISRVYVFNLCPISGFEFVMKFTFMGCFSFLGKKIFSFPPSLSTFISGDWIFAWQFEVQLARVIAPILSLILEDFLASSVFSGYIITSCFLSSLAQKQDFPFEHPETGHSPQFMPSKHANISFFMNIILSIYTNNAFIISKLNLNMEG